jgi:hypothetical protein
MRFLFGGRSDQGPGFPGRAPAQSARQRIRRLATTATRSGVVRKQDGEAFFVPVPALKPHAVGFH